MTTETAPPHDADDVTSAAFAAAMADMSALPEPAQRAVLDSEPPERWAPSDWTSDRAERLLVAIPALLEYTRAHPDTAAAAETPTRGRAAFAARSRAAADAIADAEAANAVAAAELLADLADMQVEPPAVIVREITPDPYDGLAVRWAETITRPDDHHAPADIIGYHAASHDLDALRSDHGIDVMALTAGEQRARLPDDWTPHQLTLAMSALWAQIFANAAEITGFTPAEVLARIDARADEPSP